MREEVHTERIIGGAFGMQIKKMTSLVLAAMISLSLAACGSSQTTAATSGQTSQQEVNAQSADSSGAKNAESAQDEGKAEVQQTEAAAKNESSVGKNILILYFSADNTRDVDAVSSATPMADGTSSVEWIANIIHENVGGDLIPIIPSEDYPLEYDALADYAKKERDDGGRPAFEDLGVDPASYDHVFVGYPIWWYEMPMIMDTFFDTYDFSGVTIIPFNTHAGSSDGGTYSDIRELESNATVLDGLAVRGEDVGKDSTKEAVLSWLQGLDLE